MAGISEIIIGIVILNVLFRIVKSLTSKEQKKPGRAPAAKKPWEPAWKTEKEAAPAVTVDKFEKLKGETETVPPTPVVHGEEEKSWVEDIFEAVEREFKKEEAPAYDEKEAYDKLASYDERAAAGKTVTPKAARPAETPSARRKPAKLPGKTVTAETSAAVMETLGDVSSVRTAIVLSAILGPCRAKQRYRPGRRRTL